MRRSMTEGLDAADAGGAVYPLGRYLVLAELGEGGQAAARSPGLRAAWRIARLNFGGRFLSFMDSVVAASAAEPPVDLSLEAWKVAFASEASRTS